MLWLLYVAISFVGISLVTWMFQSITGFPMELSVEILILIALAYLCKLGTEIWKELLAKNQNTNSKEM